MRVLSGLQIMVLTIRKKKSFWIFCVTEKLKFPIGSVLLFPISLVKILTIMSVARISLLALHRTFKEISSEERLWQTKDLKTYDLTRPTVNVIITIVVMNRHKIANRSVQVFEKFQQD
jgi:hypothetical protein